MRALNGTFLSSGAAGFHRRTVFMRALDVGTGTSALASQREAYAAGPTLEITSHVSSAETIVDTLYQPKLALVLEAAPSKQMNLSKRSPNVKDEPRRGWRGSCAA